MTYHPVPSITFKEYRRLFGPVPSRRLGLSLGLDLVPPKTCTLDCLYCEVGRTTNKTIDRFHLGQREEILTELADFLTNSPQKPDYVTLAGSGEPTLNAETGRIIRGVKALTPVKVAVLTNGTLMDREDVRQDLREADLVIPSLDTAIEDTFKRLNRPHPSLDLERIIRSLAEFRAGFPGRFWLEILLVAGINDSPGELEALKTAAEKIRPDLIQLNTVYRPPAQPQARPLHPDALAAAARFFGPTAEVVGGFSRIVQELETNNVDMRILNLVSRRPCTCQDLADALAVPVERVRSTLDQLKHKGLIHIEHHTDQDFFRRTS